MNTNELLAEQLSWHWETHVRPRLDGLTDDEYFWEPVPGCWSIRVGPPVTIDWAYPEPKPPPVTTIAWRLGHVIVGVFGQRNANYFGGPPMDYATFGWATTAADALRQLDDGYATWIAGVRGLSAERMEAPLGPTEGAYAEHPYKALVLHINREAIHHGAEILLLRDLYRARP
jgi:hypothetical protein